MTEITPLLRAVLLLAAVAMSMSALAKVPPVPPTPKTPVEDTYHGETVTDEYRWLEDFQDPAVRKWTEAQNRRTRAILGAISARKTITARLKAIAHKRGPSYWGLQYRGGLYFAMKSQPPKQQPFIVALKSLDDPSTERVLVDPNKLDPKGSIAIDFFVPSVDGKKLAVALYTNGTEDGTLYIYDVATGRQLPDVVPRVSYPTGGGSAAWNADGSGFYYTRYPQGTERAPEDANFYQQVYFHAIGTPVADDKLSIGEDFPRIAETALSSSEDGRYVLATVANGDGGEFAHYVLGPDGAWTQVTSFDDRITRAVMGPEDMLYLLSRQGALKGKVLRLPLQTPELAEATLIVDEGNDAIVNIVPAKNRLYVVDVVGGPNRVRVFDHAGRALGRIPVKPVSSVGSMMHAHGDDVVYRTGSYTEPSAWYRFGPGTKTPVRTALFEKSPVNFDDCTVVRAFATSKDGTKVPLTILMRKGTGRTKDNPTLLTGYGGYGVVTSPSFSASRRLWLDAGGIFVAANIRGGGEYGEAWHLAGNLTKKQNVFDDFVAVARYLIRQGYTSPAKLAIEGGSNGGLLMGAVLTQHPELFRAVVSWAGVYDVLREELTPNGEFNTTEFGTVKDPDQFRAMVAYSPYHHVKAGVQYPAVLFVAGDNDGRVNPANSRKMTAALQASGTRRPILLRTSSTTGHGQGTGLDEGIAQHADAQAFLFEQLGMTPR